MDDQLDAIPAGFEGANDLSLCPAFISVSIGQIAVLIGKPIHVMLVVMAVKRVTEPVIEAKTLHPAH